MAGREKTKNSIVAQRIKDLRKKEKMTQAQLGSMLFKSESTVRMWELGKSEPDIDTLNNLASIFGVSVDFIMGNSDTENVNTIHPSKFPKIQNDIVIVCRNGKQEIHKLTPEQLESIDILLDGYQEKNKKDE